MSNANLLAALDSALADEVLERARNVIARQDEIIAALREALERAMTPDTAMRTPAQEAAEQAFIRAGHKPEDRTCDHKHWTFEKYECGTFIVDWGD